MYCHKRIPPWWCHFSGTSGMCSSEDPKHDGRSTCSGVNFPDRAGFHKRCEIHFGDSEGLRDTASDDETYGGHYTLLDERLQTRRLSGDFPHEGFVSVHSSAAMLSFRPLYNIHPTHSPAQPFKFVSPSKRDYVVVA